MMQAKLQNFAAQLRAGVLAIGIHVLMAALVVLGTLNWEPFKQRKTTGVAIEAVIVDTSALKAQREEARQAVEMEDRRQHREEELRQQRQREQELEAERDRKLEERRKKEAQDRLKQLRLDRERKLVDERLKQQRELEQVREQREAADRQRNLEQERLKQIEAQRQRDQLAEQQKAAELQRQKNAEAQAAQFRAGEMATLETNYMAAIQSVVTQNWFRPPTAQPGLQCVLKIVQIPGGEVISAAISGRCIADEPTRRSIVAAVERVGALPYRGFEDVFAREIDFVFIYDGD